MNPRHGLPPSVVKKITEVLARFPEVESVVLFGSRARSTHKTGSDIDLALTGGALDWRVIGRIYDTLDDLLLPYRFSLIIHDQTTDPAVADHIARVGVPLFRREAVTA